MNFREYCKVNLENITEKTVIDTDWKKQLHPNWKVKKLPSVYRLLFGKMPILDFTLIKDASGKYNGNIKELKLYGSNQIKIPENIRLPMTMEIFSKATRLNESINEKVDLKGTKPANYNKKLLKKGSKVESEHTDSKKAATKIAMQHTAEFPKVDKKEKIDSDYYDELDKMEGKLKKGTKRSFADIVDEVVKETTMAGAGGAFGPNAEIGMHGGDVGNSDWYAPGDARNIFGGQVSAKSSKKKKKKIHTHRRSFPKGL
jgi:hypothetical protein